MVVILTFIRVSKSPFVVIEVLVNPTDFVDLEDKTGQFNCFYVTP